MLQAGAVGDDDGRAGIGLGLPDGLEGLGLVVAHGHLRHVYVAVVHEDRAQILLGNLLAARGEFRHGGGGRGLGGLSAGVGVNLGVQHQQIHVPVLGQHMVDAAKADVIGPAVAAHGPNGFLCEIFPAVQNKLNLLRLLAALQRGNQRVGHGAGLALVLPAGKIRLDFGSGGPGGLQVLQPQEQLLADGVLRVEEAIGKLGVVLEQGVLPRGAKAALVTAVGQDGGAAAVCRGAARSVADVHVVAHKLAHKL
ncbi:hypothetical protein SDC9_127033 [bioreactor metagenome]|uniref:Uncharacterized protein n=1 Tax=bioreactor metagenome TaxID=1076179 RepID=A0A645CS82_9ZZZZ